MPLASARFGFAGGGIREIDVQYLVIAGGGSGAGSGAGGGGGGAGGYRNSYASETSGGNSSTETLLGMPFDTPVTVTVGAGGPSGANTANRGNDSVLYTVTSIAGGAGYRSGLPANEEDGGSGGGSTNGSGTQGLGTTGQGSDGGFANVNQPGGGGGGGAFQIGYNGQNKGGGAGGNGLASSITGSSVSRAGGGGGGASTDATVGYGGGAGGTGGGGSGGNNQTSYGSVGTVNTGSGGGGSGGNTAYGGSGGSGIVIIRYVTADATISIGAGLTSTTTTSGADTIVKFTAGTGTVSFS
jgi:hypothetical protein